MKSCPLCTNPCCYEPCQASRIRLTQTYSSSTDLNTHPAACFAPPSAHPPPAVPDPSPPSTPTPPQMMEDKVRLIAHELGVSPEDLVRSLQELGGRVGKDEDEREAKKA